MCQSHAMKSHTALFLGCLALAGCATTDTADGSSSSEAALVQQTHLDRVTPAEVAAVFAPSVMGNLAKCIAGHPTTTTVDASSIAEFYKVGPRYYWDVREVVEG